MNEDSAQRVLANKSNIWLAGMKPMDARVIGHYIRLVKELNSEFKIIDDDNSRQADIVFVNVDSPEACNAYRTAVKETGLQAIVVKCSCRETAERNRSHLILPVSRHALEALLNKITSTDRTRSHKTNQVTNSDCGHLLSILVVDDSFPVRKYMEEKLPDLIRQTSQSIPIKIDFASSGHESVATIKEAKGSYDIVFLDVVMHDVDGYKICKWIKSVKDDIQVIMLTSKSSTFDKVRGKIAGCNSYLSKPPSDDALKKVLAEAIRVKESNTSYQLKVGN